MTETYRHKARGTLYTVEGHAELQAAGGPVDEGAILTVYRGEDGKLWARRASEFGDGRFEKVTTPDQQAEGESGLVERLRAQANGIEAEMSRRAGEPISSLEAGTMREAATVLSVIAGLVKKMPSWTPPAAVTESGYLDGWFDGIAMACGTVEEVL